MLHRPGMRNPFGLVALAGLADVFMFIILMLPACILVSALSLAFRYRRAGGETRQQIKWIAFAACFLGATYLGSLLGQLLFAPEAEVLFLNYLRGMSFAGIPVAVGIAILRYRLYDIEIIINRALVYGPLTAILALVYFGGVVSLQYVLRALTGSDSQLAIVASTLAIVALFSPLRRAVQDLVDRRFYRRKYDARRVLGAFSSRLKEETDLDSLEAEINSVIHETLQPAHTSLWLREPDDGTPGRRRA